MSDIPADPLDLLTSRFERAQGLPEPVAHHVAARVLEGPPAIARAAVDWAASGRMPEKPRVAGRTPASLSEQYEPTQVFTALMLLERDRHHGEEMLRRSADRLPGAAAGLVAVAVPDTQPDRSPARGPFAALGFPQRAFSTAPTIALIILAGLAFTQVLSASTAVGVLALVAVVALATRVR